MFQSMIESSIIDGQIQNFLQASMTRSAVLLLLLAAPGCQRAAVPDLLTSGSWIDLSYDYSDSLCREYSCL